MTAERAREIADKLVVDCGCVNDDGTAMVRNIHICVYAFLF